MFDRFTHAAHKVLSLACDEVRRFNHECIGTEHVLLGLVLEGRGIAAKVLKNHDVDLEKVRAEVEKMTPHDPHALTLQRPHFTPRAKRVLDLAQEEADRQHQYDIGTEHLLFGLLGENEGVAARIMVNLGLKVAEIREELLEARNVEENRRNAGQIGEAWPPVPDSFTDRARKVMYLAGQEAPFHQGVGTEHILLGLVEERGGIAARILKNFDVSPAKVRASIEKMISHSPSKGTMGQRPFTPHAQRVLDFAQVEAKLFRVEYIGTEHLLLGLLRESEGTAPRVLVGFGLKLEDIREAVLAVLKANGREQIGPDSGLALN